MIRNRARRNRVRASNKSMMLRNEVDVFHKRWKEQGPYHNKTAFEFGMMKTTSIPILTKIGGINLFGDKNDALIAPRALEKWFCDQLVLSNVVRSVPSEQLQSTSESHASALWIEFNYEYHHFSSALVERSHRHNANSTECAMHPAGGNASASAADSASQSRNATAKQEQSSALLQQTRPNTEPVLAPAPVTRHKPTPSFSMAELAAMLPVPLPKNSDVSSLPRAAQPQPHASPTPSQPLTNTPAKTQAASAKPDVANWTWNGASPSTPPSAVLMPLSLPATASEQLVVIPTAAEGVDELTRRMYELEGFGAEHVSELLLDVRTPEQMYLVNTYLMHFEFAGLTFEDALRAFLMRVAIVGETSQKDRLLGLFARRYAACNNVPRDTAQSHNERPPQLHNETACHALAFALVMLNGELYAHRKTAIRKRTRAEFVHNVREVESCEQLPEEFLEQLYDRLKNRPLPAAQLSYSYRETMASVSERGSSCSVVSGVSIGNSISSRDSSRISASISVGLCPLYVDKVNPFLVAPDFASATEFQRGLLERKAFREQDGRLVKTRLWNKLFGSSWHKFFVVLLDSHLMLFASEQAYQQFRRKIDRSNECSMASNFAVQRGGQSSVQSPTAASAVSPNRISAPQPQLQLQHSQLQLQKQHQRRRLTPIPDVLENVSSQSRIASAAGSQYVSSSSSDSDDEESSESATSRTHKATAKSPPELFRLPHAYATVAPSKPKHRCRFLLRLVDSSEYLFKPADEAERDRWISRINFAAALFSGPPISSLSVARVDCETALQSQAERPTQSSLNRKTASKSSLNLKAACESQVVLTRPSFSALQVSRQLDEQQRAHRAQYETIARAVEQFLATPLQPHASSLVRSDYEKSLAFLEEQRAKFQAYDELLVRCLAQVRGSNHCSTTSSTSTTLSAFSCLLGLCSHRSQSTSHSPNSSNAAPASGSLTASPLAAASASIPSPTSNSTGQSPVGGESAQSSVQQEQPSQMQTLDGTSAAGSSSKTISHPALWTPQENTSAQTENGISRGLAEKEAPPSNSSFSSDHPTSHSGLQTRSDLNEMPTSNSNSKSPLDSHCRSFIDD